MADDWEDLDFDFGFSAVDADELGEIVSPSKTAEVVGKVEVQSKLRCRRVWACILCSLERKALE